MQYDVEYESGNVNDEVLIALSEAEDPLELFSEKTVLCIRDLLEDDARGLACLNFFVLQLEGYDGVSDVSLTFSLNSPSLLPDDGDYSEPDNAPENDETYPEDISETEYENNTELPEEETELAEAFCFDWYEHILAVVCANRNEHVCEMTLNEDGTLTCLLDALTVQDLMEDPDGYIVILAK